MKELKYNELLTLSSVVDVQIITIEQLVEKTEDKIELTALKSEITKFKSIRTKLKKCLSDY